MAAVKWTTIVNCVPGVYYTAQAFFWTSFGAGPHVRARIKHALCVSSLLRHSQVTDMET